VERLAFGPFAFGRMRHWVLAGKTEPGRRFAATILGAEHLPPSFDSSWHHCYWSLCITAVAFDGKSCRTLTVPILVFPSTPLPRPFAPPALDDVGGEVPADWYRIETKMRLASYGCLGSSGFLRVAASFPPPAPVKLTDKDDADEVRPLIVSGVSFPVIVTIDVSHLNGAVQPDHVLPGRVGVHERICGTTSRIDDVVSAADLGVTWERVFGAGMSDVRTYRGLVKVPDSLITSFETPAFLLAVKVRDRGDNKS
jgi:hypothetical protein